jgi:hypothetical protein
VSKFVGGAESVESMEHLAPPRDILQPLIDVLLPFATRTPNVGGRLCLTIKKALT